MTIKKVFEGSADDGVHSDFLKFGRGEYKNRYMIEAKTQKDIWSVKTSAEFANFFVKKCLEKVSTGKIAVKGVIVCTFDLRSECTFDIKKVGNFQGIRKLEIDTEVEPKEILALMHKYPRVFFALTFKTDKFDLKIKPKAPKSAKPGKATDEGGEGPKVDFCSLKTVDKDLLNELFFGIGLGWKEIKISHTIKIQDIIYPKDLKTLKPEQVREQSKRKGVIVRIIESDGKKIVKEAPFEA